MPLFSVDGLREDLADAEAVIRGETGVDPHPWFRCPFGTGADNKGLIASLAELGYRVLCIDMDPQANMTVGLGISLSDVHHSMADVLSDDRIALDEVVRTTEMPGLSVAPSTLELASTEVELFTDGACRGNPGPGGWGVLLRMGDKERELAGGEPLTTNNRMELMAAISALEALKRPSTVDLHTGEIKGVEALARWDDEELGLVPPSEFIVVAEETGLIEPLGAWVMDEVARQAREWDQGGLDFEIAFNLSPRQLWQPELLSQMRTSLAAAGVPFERFVVEITESSALRDFESTVALLRDMTAEGFRLAIDDFGVELSSLSRLLEIPAHVLKVDQSFIAALSSSPDAAVMVQMIVQLAEKLGMRSHAEGVETEEQRRFLLEKGCQYGQGYLFAKPVPAGEILDLYLRSLASRMVPIPPGVDLLDVPTFSGLESIDIPADLRTTGS